MADYVVYTMPMAKYLMKEGFEWKRVAVSKKEPDRVVFYYENTPELVSAIQHYLEGRKNGIYSK